ncbi:MAG TPA: SDR family NAD(P)-dependent oxidoreductase [Candidatus Dormibacteraeota bacterium]|nr:SDR family NAD(P)-dependent oxidoreductase [Candidatus Dormibacteraeota bacterium]
MTSTAKSSHRPLALVTGASAGIGRAYAERLGSDGYDLIVVARRAERLDEVKRQLESAHGVSVQPLVADLSTESGRRAVDAAAAQPRLEVVVDSAALAYYMPFLDLPRAKAEELVNLNVLAPVQLVHAALPGMVERGKGAVISFSSLLAFSAASENPQLPARAVYSASKAFLLTLFRLLAAELRDTGVKVQIVCPGIVKTEFHTRQNMDMSGRPRLEPEEVVKASMIGLERGEVVCVPTLDDTDRLLHHDQADAEVLSANMRPSLAQRYLT